MTKNPVKTNKPAILSSFSLQFRDDKTIYSSLC